MLSNIIKQNAAEIIVLVVFLLVMSSCQTIKEINMSGSSKATQCNWVNNK